MVRIDAHHCEAVAAQSDGSASFEPDPRVRRVLIWRQGSLGDTIVALPSLHVIARSFPRARLQLLTNVGERAGIAPAAEILGGTGLIHGTIEYPKQTRSLRALAGLARTVRAWQPEVGVYLVESRSPRQHLRDFAFLRLIGVRRIIGTALDGSLSGYPATGPNGRRESEAVRLLRSVRALGEISVESNEAWDLRLNGKEHAAAAAAVAPVAGWPGFFAFSIGTKAPSNDYGDENWRAVITGLGAAAEEFALVAIGSPGEAERTQSLLTHWPGQTLNLCGSLHVRESAAVLRRAICFMGHDSGPMHLASAVGTPCVAVFSGRNPPGIWFPRGRHNRIFHQTTTCSPCGLAVCVKEGKRCILTIDPLAVARAGADLAHQAACEFTRQRMGGGTE